ncbi:hypothetical protein PVL29_003846 [Vitis rotundifolia]|uniref:Uncharacterized protein n=1 Tax=Vitis rotundifolia TaxID=103349 RepID=A0AA39E447_VITRO|nr:hypothetical protein PVL29_003846 [Vitis rotundifolia]
MCSQEMLSAVFAFLAFVDSLNSMDLDGTDAADALEVVSLLAEMKQSVNFTYSPWSALAAVPSSLESHVRCLAERSPLVQVEAIEILSRLYGDQPVVLDDLSVEQSRSIGSLTNRIINSSSLEEIEELPYSFALQRNMNRLQWMHLIYQDI